MDWLFVLGVFSVGFTLGVWLGYYAGSQQLFVEIHIIYSVHMRTDKLRRILAYFFGSEVFKITLGKVASGASFYHEKIAKNISDFYREVAEDVTEKIHSGNILDIGTGPGYLLIEIAKRAPETRLTGIDVSAEMVEIARQNALKSHVADRINFEWGDSESLRFKNSSFDMILSSGSFNSWKKPVESLNECNRTLKHGGEAWIIDFRKDLSAEQMRSLDEKMDEIRFHPFAKLSTKFYIKTCAYTKNEIVEIVRKTKFKDYKIENYGFLQEAVLVRIILKKT